ncbi:fibroleukin-like isoform X1 [Palaemon carinicauda]|uniref:fibroleukin-like isoform X1 n=1 Tax=Palaemon carinicauda TaxID=392227 RepID=UPI0035B6A51F
MKRLIIVCQLAILTEVIYCHHFEKFEAPASPIENVAQLVMSLQQELVNVRRELRNRMDTMKYELTCEIRNIKDAFTKQKGELSSKVDALSLELTAYRKRLKRGLKRIGMQNDEIKGELRSQKAEISAVKTNIYEARGQVLEKGNMLLRKVNSTNNTLVCHLTDLRIKLFKINNNLEFISNEHKELREIITRRYHQPKTYNSEDYGERVLPGCTYTPLDTLDLENLHFNGTYNATSTRGPTSRTGIGVTENNWDKSVTDLKRLFPTMPEDCKDDKKKYLEYAPIPRDCKHVFDLGLMADGVYRIQPPGLSSREVFCDHHTAGGGWTVMVARRKMTRHILFNRTWHDYEVGFGDPDKEYWIGLKALHALTDGRPHQLRADMEDWEGNTAWASYSFFSVAGPEDKYRVKVTGYTGTAGDSLRHSNMQMFSTLDRDNDQENCGGKANCTSIFPGGSCTKGRGGGGWWWGRCACAQPTGQYRRGRYQGPETGITWWHWKDSNYSLKSLVIKIRPME